MKIINKIFGTTYGLDEMDVECLKDGHDVYSDDYKKAKNCILEEDEFNKNFKVGNRVMVSYLTGAMCGVLKSKAHSQVVLVNPMTKALVEFDDGSKDDAWVRLISKL